MSLWTFEVPPDSAASTYWKVHCYGKAARGGAGDWIALGELESGIRQLSGLRKAVHPVSLSIQGTNTIGPMVLNEAM